MAESIVLPAAAAARVRTAAPAAAGVDPLGLQEQLDGLGLGGDRGGAGLRPGEDLRRLGHHAGDLAQQTDLVGELAFGVGQLADPVDHLVNPIAQTVLGLRQLLGLPAVLLG